MRIKPVFLGEECGAHDPHKPTNTLAAHAVPKAAQVTGHLPGAVPTESPATARQPDPPGGFNFRGEVSPPLPFF